MPPTCALRPVIPNNACPLRTTAAAGTELAGASFGGTVKIYKLLTNRPFFPPDRGLQSEDLHPPRGVAGSGFPPLPKFPTAASRRSLGRVSVPMWPIALSGRLPIAALVGHYPTNKLIGRGPIQKRQVRRSPPFPRSICIIRDVCGITPGFPGLSPTLG